MEVAQRSTSVAVTSSGYYTVDRYNTSLLSAGRFTMSQESITDLEGFGKAIKLDCTTADTSIGSTELLTLNQKFEGQSIQKMQKGFSNAKATTLSFYVKGNASATYVVELYDTDNSRHISKTFSVTTSWNRVSLTFPGDTTGKITADNSRSLDMNIWLHAGSGYNSGSIQDSWGALNQAGRATGISSFFDSTDREFFITGVQFELGEVATPFEHETFGDNLARCQRYYFQVGKFPSSSGYGVLGTFAAADTSSGFTLVDFPVYMRTEPTFSHSGTASDYSLYITNSHKAGSGGFSASSGDILKHMYVYTEHSGGITAGDAGHLTTNNNNTDAFLGFSAEL
jgi:hypothetical protein